MRALIAYFKNMFQTKPFQKVSRSQYDVWFEIDTYNISIQEDFVFIPKGTRLLWGKDVTKDIDYGKFFE